MGRNAVEAVHEPNFEKKNTLLHKWAAICYEDKKKKNRSKNKNEKFLPKEEIKERAEVNEVVV